MKENELETQQASESDMTKYFSGEKLYGDDFNIEQLKGWYAKEEEGYSSMGSADRENYQYEYHALNRRVLFSHLPNRIFENVLGFGSAYGDELLPILNQTKNITILEPSGLLTNTDLNGIPLKYVKPTIDGKMIFKDSEFDLIISSAALHHVANVSKIISEFYRVLRPGGFVLIREPVVTQGDWRSPRKGLTPCERGIPIDLFDSMITSTGFEIFKRTKYDFPLTKRLKVFSKQPIYNSNLAVSIDKLFSFMFQWNSHYHPTRYWQKFQPASVAYVLRRK
jgi:SAM-dependent methyltransferase